MKNQILIFILFFASALNSAFAIDPLLIKAKLEQMSAEQPANASVNTALKLYQLRNFTPIWVDDFNQIKSPEYFDLISTVTQAHLLALKPAKYLTQDMLQANSLVAAYPEAVEIHLTTILSALLQDVSRGELNPESFVAQSVRISQKPIKTLLDLLAPLAQGSLLTSQLVNAVSPTSQAYKDLLQTYGKLVNSAAPLITKGMALKLGSNSLRVVLLRQRLAVLGYISADMSNPFFDQDLKNIAIEFQNDFLLGSDGVIGSKSIAQLNVPFEKRAERLRANIERWRWMPRDLGERYLFAAVGPNMLTVVQNGSAVQEMRVITGRSDRRTPMLIDRMSSINLNPYWNVPPGIKAKDVIPSVLSNPNYLFDSRMEVLDSAFKLVMPPIWSEVDPTQYNYRQRPGPGNSLGVVKFNLNNAYAIYLHDTSHRELFVEAMRFRSSGCVRVADPVGLANTLLSGSVSPENLMSRLMPVDDAYGYPIDQRLKLPKTWPTYIFYSTVSINNLGRMVLNSDPYGYDQMLLTNMQ